MNERTKDFIADTPDHYVITPDDRRLIVSALRTLAMDSPSKWAKATALAVHIQTAKVLSS